MLGQKCIWILTIAAMLTVRILSINWLTSADMRSGPCRMLDYNTVLLSNSSIPISNNVTYTTALSTFAYIGVGIVGIEAQVTNDFSPQLKVGFATTVSVQLILQAMGDTILSMFQAYYIAIGNPLKTIIELQSDCFVCSMLNVSNGTRTEYRNGSTSFISKTLRTAVFFSAFSLHNTLGINSVLWLSVSVIPETSILSYQFITAQNNTASSICYTTIIYNEEVGLKQYLNFGSAGSIIPLNSLVTPIKYQQKQREFFGLAGFNMSRGYKKQFLINSVNYASITTGYRMNYGNYGILLSWFYYAIRQCNTTQPWYSPKDDDCFVNGYCPAGTNYVQINPGSFCSPCHYSCQICNDDKPNNCAGCDASNHRTLFSNACPCDLGYVDIGNALCVLCSTVISGCTRCSSKTICTTCSNGLFVNSINTCDCIQGQLASGYCVNIVGCVSAGLYSSVMKCLSCNQTLKFQRTSNYLCECKSGYFLKFSSCGPNCGDNLIVEQESCDDGNIIEGDGCSSLCAIETNWICDNSVLPSKCTILISPTLAVKYVKRDLNNNQMVVAIQISPSYPSKFAIMSYKPYISHQIPCTNYIVTYDVNTDYLMMTFDYNQTIEGNFYNLSLTLDPQYFTTSAVTVKISAEGMNAQLTYDSGYSNNSILQIVVISLDALALFVMILSIFSQRLIGIQMIQTIQLILFMMPLMGSIPSSLSSLEMLRYTNGYNFLTGNDLSRTYTYTHTLSAIGLQKEFLLSFNLMFIILVSVIVIMVIIRLILGCLRSNLQEAASGFQDQFDQAKATYDTWKMVFDFMFERVFFLVGFMSMFLIIFALSVQLSDPMSAYTLIVPWQNLMGAVFAVAILIGMLIMVLINAVFPRSNLFPFYLNSNLYPVYYFAYQSILAACLCFLYTQQWTIYLLMGMTFLNGIFLFVIRPYPHHIHNVGIVFNQIVIIGALGVYLFGAMTVPTSSNNQQMPFQICIYVMLGLIFVVIVLSAVRLWIWRMYFNEKSIRKQESYDQAYQAMISAKRPHRISKIEMQNAQKTKKAADLPLALEWTYNSIVFTNEMEPTYKLNDGNGRMLLDKTLNDNNGEQTNRKIKNQMQQQAQYAMQSPYDEAGYIKGDTDSEGDGEGDVLKMIKNKLRQDLTKKMITKGQTNSLQSADDQI